MRPRVRGVLMALASALASMLACANRYGDATPDPVTTSSDASADAAPDGSSDADPPIDATAAAIDASPPLPTPLVLVPVGTPFRIEATEVSVAQYTQFKRSLTSTPEFPNDKCPGKTALGPPTGCTARLADTDPMTCVDWCDASAYCKAIGRELCGDAHGGALDPKLDNSPEADAWFIACRGAGARTFPYGDDVVEENCATSRKDPVAVGSLATCQGGEPGLYDMSGNAAEWTNNCSSNGCVARGGSYKSSASSCACSTLLVASPAVAFADIGFRCCRSL